MPQQSHLDKLCDEEKRQIVNALLVSAAQGDMARSAYLAGKHEGVARMQELHRQAARVGADPDGDGL